MKHTNEFLRGMFAAYMGCGVGLRFTERVYICDVMAISRDRVSIVEKNSKRPQNAYYNMCKPILTPLSEITDSDAVEVANICNGNETEKHFMLDFSIVKKGYQIGAPQKGILFTREVIDYLRSPYRPNGTPKPVYDCGYMHIQSLISADLAISSKQI